MNKVRAVIFKEGDIWVAQCLEYDIGAQGESREHVFHRLEQTIVSEALIGTELAGKAFDGIKKAPIEFFVMYEDSFKGAESVHISLEELNAKYNTDPKVNWLGTI